MSLTTLFQQFNQLKVIIVGDVMIDAYSWGTVDRISPEAPVPVVNIRKQERRLGGAANVALNIQALGATPILCAVVGKDDEALQLQALLDQQKMRTDGLIGVANRVTTVKHRILAGSQQLLRVDSETDKPIDHAASEALVEQIKKLAEEAHVIIFEDYDKGVLTQENIEQIIAFANEKKIPTIIDPKKRNFWYYKNSTLFKPNLKELREGLKMDIDLATNLPQAVEQFRKQMGIETALITLSEHGVYIANEQEQHRLPAHKREIADVSGAGDTVVSIAALCVALNLDLQTTAFLANLGGGLVCEYLGVVPIDKNILLAEAQRVTKTG